MGFRKQDVCIVIVLQCLLLVLFGVFARYGPEGYTPLVYPMFQDVHVMIFVGFGFLMTFLKRYGYSAVGFNFLLAGLTIQWALLCNGFYDLNKNNHILINVMSLAKADIAVAAVLISMGALLGRTSYIQLLLMGMVEIAIFSANSYLGATILKVSDAGGSIFVHTFGAYFGLAASYALHRKNTAEEMENDLEGSSYTSDLFAMIGTLFLWLFWPSFNAIELVGDEQQRAVINTYLSLASCCVAAFVVSALLTSDHKFDMVHVQNSTLAGGVAVGTSANLMLQPYGAVIVGILAGVLSVYGYTTLTPWMTKRLRIRDTCGVHNLHGMPGVLAGIVGAIMVAIPQDNSKDYFNGRERGSQAGYQILGIVATLIIAVISGLVTGFLLGTRGIFTIPSKEHFDDAISWEVAESSCTHVVSTTVERRESTNAHKQHYNPAYEPTEGATHLPT